MWGEEHCGRQEGHRQERPFWFVYKQNLQVKMLNYHQTVNLLQ